MKRLFVAIKLIPDENFLKTYDFLKNKLNINVIRWVKPDLMHLTLKFLGETPVEKIPEIKQILKEFTKDKKAIGLELNKCGIFGSSYDPKVIWFAASNNDEIKTMGNQLIHKFNEHGFVSDRQNFVPHLTIGRIKKIINKEVFQSTMVKMRDKKLQKFYIDEIILYQSILKPSGPIYKEIEKYRLV